MTEVCIDRLLETVQKPTRYIGGEYNSVHKNADDVEIRFAFAFPDVYEIGMSHLGLRILYYLMNKREDTWCERVFAPWTDMEEIMRRENIPLFALESRDPVKEFDLIGFTLQYEMSYTNVLNMLHLAGIPQLSRDRGPDHPFIIGGGPCAYNSEPLADFFDFFVLGEGEEIIGAVLDLYKQWKVEGKSRGKFLEMAAGLEGVYVPSLYSVEYSSSGTVKNIVPLNGRCAAKIKKVIIEDFDSVYFPDRIIVPYMDIVHDRAIIELFRGCTRGCRFCQAGMVYRPVREKKPKTLMQQAEKLLESTGYEEISLASLSTSDYTQLSSLIRDMIERFGRQGVGISLPSLRIDSFSLDLINEIQKVRKTGLTFAPEAGTQRLRDVINKGVTEEDLLESVGNAFRCGYGTVKLYFMVGLPTETIDDVNGIKDLVYRVIDRYYETDRQSRGKGLRITASTSCFVPKPFTPFQWEPQDTMEVLNKKQDFLKQELRHRAIAYNWHQPETSFLEAVFARGDRRLCQVLLKAWENGCRFDGWMEHFNFKGWIKAFRECGVDPDFYALRRRSYDEFFPWDHIDIGVSKEFLVSEHKRALEGKTTPHCRDGCINCGITKAFGGGICDAIDQS